MSEDHRRVTRVQAWGVVPKTATIIIDEKSPTIRCTLIDISAGGACLEVANPERLPDHFELLQGKLKKRCFVVWRRDHRVGVQF
jgi:c-di-GMP-binding flagellar brake protein YcgR